MFSLEHFVAELVGRGVELWTDGGDIHFRAPPGVVLNEDRERLKLEKTRLLEFLNDGRRLAPTTFAQNRKSLLYR